MSARWWRRAAASGPAPTAWRAAAKGRAAREKGDLQVTVTVALETTVTRHTPGFPRLVVVPATTVAPLRLEGTTVVEGTVNGIDLGRRTLKRWDRERWWLELPEAWCRKAGVEEGDSARVELRVASTELPSELGDLIENNPAARRCWGELSPAQRRMLREDVLAAKRSETRQRRARKGLGLGG